MAFALLSLPLLLLVATAAAALGTTRAAPDDLTFAIVDNGVGVRPMLEGDVSIAEMASGSEARRAVARRSVDAALIGQDVVIDTTSERSRFAGAVLAAALEQRGPPRINGTAAPARGRNSDDGSALLEVIAAALPLVVLGGLVPVSGRIASVVRSGGLTADLLLPVRYSVGLWRWVAASTCCLWVTTGFIVVPLLGVVVWSWRDQVWRVMVLVIALAQLSLFTAVVALGVGAGLSRSPYRVAACGVAGGVAAAIATWAPESLVVAALPMGTSALVSSVTTSAAHATAGVGSTALSLALVHLLITRSERAARHLLLEAGP